MDYLKVPELPEYWDERMFAWIERTREVSDIFNSDGSHTFLATLLRTVYTPTTGLLAQIEDQKRVIEELKSRLGHQQKLVEELRP